MHRYAVGALARIIAASVSSPDSNSSPSPSLITPRQRKAALRAAMTALRSGDGQAACFATAALRRVASDGDLTAQRHVVSLGAPGMLLELLAQPGKGWAAEQELDEVMKNRQKTNGRRRSNIPAGGSTSEDGDTAGEVAGAAAAARRVVMSAQANGGVRLCAMRALEAFATASSPGVVGPGVLAAAILKTPGGITLLAEVANGEHGCKSAALQKQASVLLTTLGL